MKGLLIAFASAFVMLWSAGDLAAQQKECVKKDAKGNCIEWKETATASAGTSASGSASASASGSATATTTTTTAPAATTTAPAATTAKPEATASASGTTVVKPGEGASMDASATATTSAPAATGGNQIRAFVLIAGTTVTDTEKVAARRQAEKLAHMATYGFHFYYVHRMEARYQDELFYRGYSDGGKGMMYLAPVSTIGDSLEGVKYTEAAAGTVGGKNVATVDVDVTSFDYSKWEDYYVDRNGKEYRRADVEKDATLIATRRPNRWHLNYLRRMESEAVTVSVKAALGTDPLYDLVSKAIIDHYKPMVEQQQLLNFVSQAFLAGISNYEITTDDKNVSTVSGSVTLLLPKAIGKDETGALYHQWRANFFNIRDISGISEANKYYGDAYYAR